MNLHRFRAYLSTFIIANKNVKLINKKVILEIDCTKTFKTSHRRGDKKIIRPLTDKDPKVNDINENEAPT